jgi:hypothetical protein
MVSLLDVPGVSEGLAKDGGVANVIAKQKDEPRRHRFGCVAVEPIIEVNKLDIEAVGIGELERVD